MKSFFSNREILVTGAAGFIGSHLTKKLLSEGAKIHIFLKETSNLIRLENVLGDLTVWYGDLRDYQAVNYCIKNSRPQIIYHLATFRDVSRNLELIETMIEINVKGALNLMRGVFEERINLDCFINTGSSEEYGDGAVPFDEKQREVPVSPYSASKVAVTYFCQMLYKTMGLPIITLRPFLVYGPDQDTDMFIPSLIHHCLERKDFQMTTGDQTREFNYIEDIVDAYLLAAHSPRAIGEIINIGNGVEYRIKDIAEKIVDMMGEPIQLLVGALPKRPGEAEHFFCDCKKAKNLLGWSPKVGLDEGLLKTIEWYEKFFSKRFAELK
jgi:nucleoside-diphosphate-sugar epimerase